ncbi:xylulose 5-phosphate 3-epimerase [Thermithiobacillus plumbiphilus]|uniref:Xylulose 5-phosphate 3-epimerase n=1 Tax=Thermithiobacillus plumbiphilus TaxID=1729899 RepID=A0ABU9D6R3_9PROT
MTLHAHDARLDSWMQGYGAIRHEPQTVDWVRRILADLDRRGDLPAGTDPIELLMAADRLANSAMWLVVHMTYAQRVRLDGAPLEQRDFKSSPQGHTGGALNMAVGYAGYMLANALTGTTRAWLMGQGHTVAAIDTVNLLLDNMSPAHAERYELSEAGLSRYVDDFYSYRLNAQGNPDSPLGSHVNVHTAGGLLEGGYLGFAELQYVHMPLPGERLIAFLSDGAFEEQRGSDWAPRWWRAEDSGLVVPIMIYNGRRIDQRAILSQEAGLDWFKQYLDIQQFDPIAFDGRDPAAFACMILEGEWRLTERAERALAGAERYPLKLPYGIAVTQKGAGFYGAGSNDAHNLPLGTNPSQDPLAVRHFNAAAKRLFVPPEELERARMALQNHAQTGRPKEREHPLAVRNIRVQNQPTLHFQAVSGDRRNPAYRTAASPMDGVDQGFLAYVKANPQLRPRVGNPDEMRSNRMNATLDYLKHRVTEPEAGIAEAVDGKVITALNEEAVVCACLGNKGGINLTVTYEAFSPKMLGAVRQEIIWSDHLFSVGRTPGWISLPLVLTSNTYENGKNERSHQDTSMCEALLGEPSDVSRVLFPADYNTALLSLEACFATQGRIFTLVAPKSEHVPNLFGEMEARQLLADGAMTLSWACSPQGRGFEVSLTAIGAYQLIEVLRAAERLDERGVCVMVNYMIEPGRFRDPRGRREAAWQAPEALRQQLYPETLPHRVFVTHTHPELMAGVLRPLDSGHTTIFLGFTNHGGTLDTPGMLFVNRQSWAHIVRAAARSLGREVRDFLEPEEIDALERRRTPEGILI